MALSSFPDISKHLQLDDGTRYAFAHVKPTSPSKPTFLFLHGFPSSSYDWRHQIKPLTAHGYGVLVPDLLGYGDTDSPVEVEAYSTKNMAGHLAQILAKEGIAKVIGVGHDWGSGLLSRFYTYHSDLLLGLVFISVGYIEPSGVPMDLAAVNALAESFFGYPTFGYWELFITDEAGKLLDSHPDSISSLVYPEDPESWKVNLGPLGAAEAWITANKTSPRPVWLTAEEEAKHKDILSKGYTGPLNWYKAAIRGVDVAAEATLPAERKHVNLPTLLVAAEKDYITRPELQKQAAAQWVKEVQIEDVPTGHWVQLELPEKLNQLLVEFATGL